MKKRALVFTLFLLIVFSLILVSADENNTQINKAYQCLQDKVSQKCSTLTLEQQIFSLLALRQSSTIKTECINSIKALSSDTNKCWPQGTCNLKQTALATLALSAAGEDTSKSEAWLLSQNKTPTDLQWYLEVENPAGATTCRISYGTSTNTVQIYDDKTISGDAGSCLSLESGNNYWFRISSNCYDREFKVTCDKQFLTTFLYKKANTATVYVSSEVQSASANGNTSQKIQTLCFSQGSTCNYEGSLWAAYVLSKDYDVNLFLPYLIANADSNRQFLPDAFLISLVSSGNYVNSLLTKQKNNQYWQESTNRYYDTALAMLALSSQDTSTAKDNTKEFLLSQQDTNGCWQNDVRNTAFILYAVWPQDTRPGAISPGTASQDCETSGKFCLTRTDCTDAGGREQQGYDCSGTNICCSSRARVQTCAQKGGQQCLSEKVCSISTESSSDIANCCLGDCQDQSATRSPCEISGGRCTYSCSDTEEDKSSSAQFTCPSANSKCCVTTSTTSSSGGISIWIWVLIILIVLVLLGILFRNKIREIMFRAKNKPSSSPSTGMGLPPRFPPSGPMARPMQRRILPIQQSRPVIAKPSPMQKEFDETLKKLKDMGK